MTTPDAPRPEPVSDGYKLVWEQACEAMKEAAAKVADAATKRAQTEQHRPGTSPEMIGVQSGRGAMAMTIARAIRSLKAPPYPGLDRGTGWRSMETAPKDGTYVIIAVKLHHMTEAVSGSAYYRGEDDDSRGAWWWAGEGPGDYHADHIPAEPYAWMPMPLPPPPGEAT